MTNHIWFVEPNAYHNNFGIMASGDLDFISGVDDIVTRDIVHRWTNDPDYDAKALWGAFHQGTAKDWTYWEFWSEQTPEFRAKVEVKIASICTELGSFEPVQSMPK